MNSADIQNALVGFGSNCLWSPRRVTAARNTNGVSYWESDLLIIHESGWTWEIEIKVSVSDFRREFTKKAGKHRRIQEGKWTEKGYFSHERESLIRKFFFAMPVDVYEKVKDQVPDYAGVILLDPAKKDGWGRLRPWIAKKAKDLPARRATPEDRAKMKESVYYRYWGLKETEASLSKEPGS